MESPAKWILKIYFENRIIPTSFRRGPVEYFLLCQFLRFRHSLDMLFTWLMPLNLYLQNNRSQPFISIQLLGESLSDVSRKFHLWNSGFIIPYIQPAIHFPRPNVKVIFPLPTAMQTMIWFYRMNVICIHKLFAFLVQTDFRVQPFISYS